MYICSMGYIYLYLAIVTETVPLQTSDMGKKTVSVLAYYLLLL